MARFYMFTGTRLFLSSWYHLSCLTYGPKTGWNTFAGLSFNHLATLLFDSTFLQLAATLGNLSSKNSSPKNSRKANMAKSATDN